MNFAKSDHVVIGQALIDIISPRLDFNVTFRVFFYYSSNNRRL
jgi:hypothetical protein